VAFAGGSDFLVFCGGKNVVGCVVNAVFCVVVFGLLETCQLFEIYFWVFPFWESAFGKKAYPGA
jgi:hypothetical protein